MSARGPLRVVQLVNSTEYGGVEEHVRELGSGLVRAGDQVRIVCPPAPAADRFAASAGSQGLDVQRLELAGGSSPRALVGSISSLRRMLRAWRPDVLHVHLTGYTGGRVAVLAARSAQVGAILCTAHLAPSKPVPARVRAARQLLNVGVHRFLAVSEHSLNLQVRYLAQPRSRSAVAYNGVDPGRFPETVDRGSARRSLGLPAGSPVIGTIARLSPQKSIETLIESLPTIFARRPNVHVLVVGDGPQRDRLSKLAEKLGVADRLHLAGFRTDIPQCLAAMDVFVLPSLFEGLPISILEAMASGLPVVATSVDGVPEAVVDGVTGLLIRPGHPRRLAESVLELLEDPARASAMGAAGRERVRDRFTIDRFISSVRGQYEVVRGTGRRRDGRAAARRPQASVEGPTNT